MLQIFKIQMIPIFDPPCNFNIGDVVRFATAKSETGLAEIKIQHSEGNTIIIKSGQTRLISPAMVVLEIVRETGREISKFDEGLGLPIRSDFKLKCQWFSQKTGKFEDRWFDSCFLDKTECLMDISSISSINFKINDAVTLRTILLSNRQIAEIIQHELKVFNASIKYKLSKTYDNLEYEPPKMYNTPQK